MKPEIEMFDHIIAIISYSIFRTNTICKFNNENYAHKNIEQIVKGNLIYYKSIIDKTDCEMLNIRFIDSILHEICI